LGNGSQKCGVKLKERGNKMEYTKGEWKVYMTDIDKPRWEICAGENGEVGVAKTIYDDDVPLKEKEANAHLIAAAPKRYEALGELLEITHDLTLGDGSPDPQVEAANRKARQARAKAEGKENDGN